MIHNNIFAGVGLRAQFVMLIYNELMKREFVSFADILCIYYRREPEYYRRINYSSETGYGELKKAFLDVRSALEKKNPKCIVSNGKGGKGKAFKYVGESNDPLSAERKAIVQKSIEDYATFCKASAGILPASWFSAFFENTQLQLDLNREHEEGTAYIRSSLEQNLTNIHLLPVFYKAITHKQVLRLTYQSFGKAPFSLTFHPQFLKEYNGRWFVFGESDREPFYAYTIPLDRIVSELEIVDNVEYIDAPKGFYQDYFKNIIGVTHEKGSKVEQVIIRTKTEYQHGLILTKPFHHSQQEILPFGEHDDGCYGKIALTIEPNRELYGKILMYGDCLEVMQPLSLKKQIKIIIKQLLELYS